MEQELTYLVILVGLMAAATFLVSCDLRSFFTGMRSRDSAGSAEKA